MLPRAPRKRHKLLHRGSMVRVYRTVLDEARDCQKEGRRFDLDAASFAASHALVLLDSTCYDVSRALRMERRFRNPALAGGYDAAS